MRSPIGLSNVAWAGLSQLIPSLRTRSAACCYFNYDYKSAPPSAFSTPGKGGGFKGEKACGWYLQVDALGCVLRGHVTRLSVCVGGGGGWHEASVLGCFGGGGMLGGAVFPLLAVGCWGGVVD